MDHGNYLGHTICVLFCEVKFIYDSTYLSPYFDVWSYVRVDKLNVVRNPLCVVISSHLCVICVYSSVFDLLLLLVVCNILFIFIFICCVRYSMFFYWRTRFLFTFAFLRFTLIFGVFLQITMLYLSAQLTHRFISTSTISVIKYQSMFRICFANVHSIQCNIFILFILSCNAFDVQYSQCLYLFVFAYFSFCVQFFLVSFSCLLHFRIVLLFFFVSHYTLFMLFALPVVAVLVLALLTESSHLLYCCCCLCFVSRT